MKLSLPITLLSLCGAAHAALLHHDVSLLTYTDFGQNCGRYSTAEVNALLTELNKNGVTINYTGGQASYILPQSMIDFSSVVDYGNSTAVGYGFVATAKHLNGWQIERPTFSERHVGAKHTIQYQGIEYSDSDAFSLTAVGDSRLLRLSKIATDTTSAAVYDYSSTITELYSAGAGDCYQKNSNGGSSLMHYWSQSIDGSIMTSIGVEKVDKTGFGQTDARGCIDDSLFIQSQIGSWGSDGITTANPLPALEYYGDSGSPVFIWDAEANRYEFIGTTEGISEEDRINQYAMAPYWTAQTMNSFNKVAGLDADHALNLSLTDKSLTVTDSKNRSGTAAYAALTDQSGNSLAEFAVLEKGQSTWKSLSGLKDSDNWYNYGYDYAHDVTNSTAYLNATKNAADGNPDYADLFLTENLILQAKDSEIYTVTVKESIDTGIGFLGFTRASDVEVGLFILKGEEGVTLDTAGMVIDSNVIVQCELTHTDADNMREWRKTGNGHLIIAGQGNNEIFLNIGGSGTTLLEQQGGYAAHSIIANTGSRVILNDVGQIARRFTSGAGGSVLDFNGIAEWKESTHFDIHALTQDARFTNSNGSTALHFNRGSTFLGSFTDTADSSLKVIYEGSDKWVLNCIHTHLQHADSGLTVASGHVSLAGNLTEHARGSIPGVNNATNRYTHEDDWHYADATMNVTVLNGGTFELNSHARLTGKVTVQNGGTYIMREGVRHAQEYIEGGYTLENTADIRAFYGHHGDTQLDSGSTLRLTYNEGVTVENTYSGNLTGGGTVQVDLGSEGSSFLLTGDISQFTGDISLNSGTLRLGESGNVSISKADTATPGLLRQIKSTDSALSGSATSIISNTILGIQKATSFTIADMLLTNVRIVSTGGPVILQHLKATQLELSLGDFSAVTNTTYNGFENNSHSFSTDTLSGITLNSAENAAALSIDLGVFYSLFSMEPGKYDLTITLNGFTMTDYSSGLFFSNDSWLGQLLAAQNTTEYNSDSGAFALDTVGNSDSVSINFEALANNVGTLITITNLYVPEPATVSLSLLALATLATRRRRK